MKRFLMLLAVAAVAGAMYVAAAPGSQQAAGPTAAQFNRLKKQVAALNKSLTALKKDEKQTKSFALAAAAYIGGCFLDTNDNIENLPVNEFGTTSSGFLFGAPGTTATAARTALDVDTSGNQLALIQEVTPACVTGTTAAPNLAHSSTSRLQRWAQGAR